MYKKFLITGLAAILLSTSLVVGDANAQGIGLHNATRLENIELNTQATNLGIENIIKSQKLEHNLLGGNQESFSNYLGTYLNKQSCLKAIEAIQKQAPAQSKMICVPR
jgi:hypothetical protein